MRFKRPTVIFDQSNIRKESRFTSSTVQEKILEYLNLRFFK